MKDIELKKNKQESSKSKRRQHSRPKWHKSNKLDLKKNKLQRKRNF